MPERRRPVLRPLPPDLAGPVRDFTERLREIYWERLELNQRELAAALHLTKSPISRYLNGQEVMPAPTVEQFLTLTQLTAQERDQLRALREQAEAALSGTEPAPADTTTRPRFRRVALWAVPVVAVLAGAVVALVLVNSDDGSSGSSGCPQKHRQYTVTAEGDVLDESRHDIGDVHRGDTFTMDTPPTNPYQARHYGHVLGRDVTGFVDQAKLTFVGEVCG